MPLLASQLKSGGQPVLARTDPLERNYARCAGGAPPASPFHAQRVGNAGGELKRDGSVPSNQAIPMPRDHARAAIPKVGNSGRIMPGPSPPYHRAGPHKICATIRSYSSGRTGSGNRPGASGSVGAGDGAWPRRVLGQRALGRAPARGCRQAVLREAEAGCQLQAAVVSFRHASFSFRVSRSKIKVPFVESAHATAPVWLFRQPFFAPP